MNQIANIEERKERDADFVREYVDNGGNATQAFDLALHRR